MAAPDGAAMFASCWDAEDVTGAPHGGAALLQPTSVLAAGQNLGAGGIQFRRAFESPEGGGGLWPPEPKKKHQPVGWCFFLSCVDKKDAHSKVLRRNGLQNSPFLVLAFL